MKNSETLTDAQDLRNRAADLRKIVTQFPDSPDATAMTALAKMLEDLASETDL